MLGLGPRTSQDVTLGHPSLEKDCDQDAHNIEARRLLVLLVDRGGGFGRWLGFDSKHVGV